MLHRAIPAQPTNSPQNDRTQSDDPSSTTPPGCTPHPRSEGLRKHRTSASSSTVDASPPIDSRPQRESSCDSSETADATAAAVAAPESLREKIGSAPARRYPTP